MDDQVMLVTKRKQWETRYFTISYHCTQSVAVTTKYLFGGYIRSEIAVRSHSFERLLGIGSNEVSARRRMNYPDQTSKRERRYGYNSQVSPGNLRFGLNILY